MIIVLKIQKILQTIQYFVCVRSIKDKGSHLTSNFGKLKEFCDEKTPEITYFSIPFISQEKVEKIF